MAVWTISFEAGSGGELVARALAERAAAPLIDRQVVVAIAHALEIEFEEADQLEHHPPGGRLEQMGLAAAALAPLGAGAVAELRRQPTLRAVAERLIRDAAHQRCVILGRGGFLILADHPGTIHIRLRAPLEWRVARHASHECISREEARRVILAEDHTRDAYLRRLYGRHFADLSGFHLVIDASRFRAETIVEMALVAARIEVDAADKTSAVTTRIRTRLCSPSPAVSERPRLARDGSPSGAFGGPGHAAIVEAKPSARRGRRDARAKSLRKLREAGVDEENVLIERYSRY